MFRGADNERGLSKEHKENTPCTLLKEGGALDGHHKGRGYFGVWVKNKNGGYTCALTTG